MQTGTEHSPMHSYQIKDDDFLVTLFPNML